MDVLLELNSRVIYRFVMPVESIVYSNDCQSVLLRDHQKHGIFLKRCLNVCQFSYFPPKNIS